MTIGAAYGCRPQHCLSCLGRMKKQHCCTCQSDKRWKIDQVKRSEVMACERITTKPEMENCHLHQELKSFSRGST